MWQKFRPTGVSSWSLLPSCRTLPGDRDSGFRRCQGLWGGGQPPHLRQPAPFPKGVWVGGTLLLGVLFWAGKSQTRVGTEAISPFLGEDQCPLMVRPHPVEVTPRDTRGL